MGTHSGRSAEGLGIPKCDPWLVTYLIVVTLVSSTIDCRALRGVMSPVSGELFQVSVIGDILSPCPV
jgi:hypothetical protein